MVAHFVRLGFVAASGNERAAASAVATLGNDAFELVIGSGIDHGRSNCATPVGGAVAAPPTGVALAPSSWATRAVSMGRWLSPSPLKRGMAGGSDQRKPQ